jgi:3-methyladenine DNA glycosylase AlkD
MTTLIKKEIQKLADPEKAKALSWFFKTGEGEYGYGDKFLGIVMPKLRILAKKYFKEISLNDALKLLKSKFHEERMLALLILMFKYKTVYAAVRQGCGNKNELETIFRAYLANTKYINNWDLIDVTCRDIIGAYLLDRDKSILYKLAKSKNIWEKRISIISTAYFISENKLTDTYKLSKILLQDSHDLIHKAVGWMLREAGKRDKEKLVKFLEQNRLKMPRTMLRYAIEKFSPSERKHFLSK